MIAVLIFDLPLFGVLGFLRYGFHDDDDDDDDHVFVTMDFSISKVRYGTTRYCVPLL